jgi:cysteine sulfinate desulfinase/cysteine desulfurase-like protein
VTRLPVGPDGLLSLDDVKAALRDDVAIVAVMLCEQ